MALVFPRWTVKLVFSGGSAGLKEYTQRTVIIRVKCLKGCIHLGKKSIVTSVPCPIFRCYHRVTEDEKASAIELLSTSPPAPKTTLNKSVISRVSRNSRVERRPLTEHLDSDLSGVRLSVSVARRAPVLDRLVGVTRAGYTAQSEDCCPGQHSSRFTHFGPLDPGGWGPSHVTGEIQILPLDDWAIWRHSGTSQNCVDKQNRK